MPVFPAPVVKPVPRDAALVGKVDSAVVVGLEPKTKTIPRTDGTANRESSVDTESTTTGTAPDGSPTKTQTTTTTDAYKTQFVKVYQDAGVIGASMLTLLVLCFLLGMFSLRILKMYKDLNESRDKTETLRLQYFDTLTTAVLAVETGLHEVAVNLKSDHNTQDNNVANVKDLVKSVADKLDNFVFTKRDA